MQIHTTARHFELDPEDKLFAEERIAKLSRFARDLMEAHLVVTAEGYRHSAEITLHVKGHAMISKEESTEPRLAIDLAADALEKQLRKLKDRRATHKRVRAADAPDGVVTETTEEAEFEGED